MLQENLLKKMHKITCVVPVYNESTHIVDFINDLIFELKNISNLIEIIIVNDGSSDTTAIKLKAFELNSDIKYIELSRNFGKESAITAALPYVSGDCCFIMDSDYQHPFKYLEIMYDYWVEGFDIAYTYIINRESEAFFTKTCKSIYYKYLLNPDKISIPRDAGDFRLLDIRVIKSLILLKEKNRYMKGLYSWVGYRSIGVPYSPDVRKAGVSKFRLFDLVGLAIDGIVSFSTKPLIYSIFIGLFIAIFSFIYAIYIIYDTFANGVAVGGWPSIIVSIMFFSGVQLFFVGILGIYIGKIYEESKNRPIYLIDHKNSYNI